MFSNLRLQAFTMSESTFTAILSLVAGALVVVAGGVVATGVGAVTGGGFGSLPQPIESAAIVTSEANEKRARHFIRNSSVTVERGWIAAPYIIPLVRASMHGCRNRHSGVRMSFGCRTHRP